MSGGGLPPPKRPWCPGHAGAENRPASPYLYLLVLGINQLSSSAGLPWPGRPCGTSVVLPPWPRLSNSSYTLPLAHVMLSCALPSILPPSTPRTPCTAPVPSASPGRRVNPPLRLGPRLLAWVADHDNYPPNICPQAHPIEQAYQGNKFTLEPSWVQQCNHAIIRRGHYDAYPLVHARPAVPHSTP